MNANPDAEERAQFMLRMRARGIQDLSLLRALERAPRSLFMPQRYQDIAARDIVLPIGCGQTAAPPSVVAAMIEALSLNRAHSVFEIGSGTGYATALLSQLAGQVLSVERCQSLALEASTRLTSFGVVNAQVAWADGLSPSVHVGRFGAAHRGRFTGIPNGRIDGTPRRWRERVHVDGDVILFAIDHAIDDIGRHLRNFAGIGAEIS